MFKKAHFRLSKSLYLDLLCLFFLFLMCLIYHYKLFVNPGIYAMQDVLRGDITHYSYPMKELYSRDLKSFQLPLWSNLIYSGYPILAEGFIGAFFLPNLLLYFSLPTPAAFNLSYLLSYFLMASGVFIYCRYVNLSRFPSLLAGVVFTFSMFNAGHLLHLNVLQTISLMPWLILATEIIARGKFKIGLVLYCLFLSQDYFAGFPQVSLYLGIAALIYLLFRISQIQNKFKVLMIFICANLIVLGLVSIQLFPTLQLYTQSTRSAVSEGDNTVYPFQLQDLAYFVNPFSFGDPSNDTYDPSQIGFFWENNVYIGLIPLALIIFLFLSSKKHSQNPLFKPFITFLILSLFFSLRWMFFLYDLPPFSLFRLPQRSLFVAMFSLALLSAISLEYILNYLKNKIKLNRVKIAVFSVLVIGLSFLSLFIPESGYSAVIPWSVWLKPPPTASFIKNSGLSGRILQLSSGQNWFTIDHSITHGWQGDKAQVLLTSRYDLNPNINMLFDIPSIDGYIGSRTQDQDLINKLFAATLTRKDSQILPSAEGY